MDSSKLFKISALGVGGYLAYQLWVRRNLDRYLNFWLASINIDKHNTSIKGVITLTGTLMIQNTGPRGILLSRISGDLFYRGSHIGSIITANNLDIQPGKVNIVPFIITLPSIRIITSLAAIAIDRYKGMPVVFDSTVYFHLPLLGRIPFTDYKLEWK